MEIRYGMNPKDVDRYTTKELREELVYDNFFIADEITYMFSHIDRALVGGAVPRTQELCLDDFINAKEDLGAEIPLENREVACINLGGEGYVVVDGEKYEVGYTTALYIGKDSEHVTFGTADYSNPAKFYFFSTSAHTKYETEIITKEMAVKIELGSIMECNERVIHQYIRPGVKDSCQVLLGYTQLKEGSVWNSMPAHTHERRTEAYMYFNMKETDRVVHLMGEPENTRHLIMENEQLVFSPAWSVHSGVGSSNYGFIWGMAGENRDLGDAVAYKINELK